MCPGSGYIKELASLTDVNIYYQTVSGFLVGTLFCVKWLVCKCWSFYLSGAEIVLRMITYF